MAALARYDWPGNVRELQHALERAAALRSNAVILPHDLPPKVAGGAGPQAAPSGSTLRLQDVVRNHLRRVLTEARWNKKLAAQLLGIHRRTLYRLTKRHGISREERK